MGYILVIITRSALLRQGKAVSVQILCLDQDFKLDVVYMEEAHPDEAVQLLHRYTARCSSLSTQVCDVVRDCSLLGIAPIESQQLTQLAQALHRYHALYKLHSETYVLFEEVRTMPWPQLMSRFNEIEASMSGLSQEFVKLSQATQPSLLLTFEIQECALDVYDVYDMCVS